MDISLFYQFLSDDELLRISTTIKEMEKITAGEIVISIKGKREYFLRKKSISQLALHEFHNLKISKTRDKTGILFYILLDDREFYILADEGINSKVPDNTWEEIKDETMAYFKQGDPSAGLIHAVKRIGLILSQHFPIKPDDTNEIPNRVIFKP